jgi:hypothetical protein
LRFATVTVIGPGWLLSSNEILPMPGTLGRTPRPLWTPWSSSSDVATIPFSLSKFLCKKKPTGRRLRSGGTAHQPELLGELTLARRCCAAEAARVVRVA